MKNLLVLLAVLPVCCPAVLTAQESAKPEQKKPRIVRVLLPGQKMRPVFKELQNSSVEVDPESKLLMPTTLDVTWEGKKATAGERQTGHAIWPNRILKFVQKEMPPVFSARLSRTYGGSDALPIEVSCNIGNLEQPLIVIYAQSGEKGWDAPQVKVLDLSPAGIPDRSVYMVNLTKIPLGVRFANDASGVKPLEARIFKPNIKENDAFKYSVDAFDKSGNLVSVVNSTTSLTAKQRVVAYAYADLQPVQGYVPIRFNFVEDSIQTQ